MEKVIAVVVTANRRPLLSRCITALKNQTRTPDAILIVSTETDMDTAQWAFSQDSFYIHQKNTEDAQGFVAGIEWAYKNGYSWIWCMEDNGYPKEDALEKMLAADTGRLCLYNNAVLHNNDKKAFAQMLNVYATIDEITTKLSHDIGYPLNGIMIHRNIVERVGIPKQKLFLSGYEAEYYYRITRQNSIPVCTVAGSIYYNPVVTQVYKKDWDYKADWKIYFYIRNRLCVSEARFNTKLVAWLNYCGFLFAMSAAVLMYQKTDKAKKLRFLIWPAIDAFAHNFEATPQLIVQRLSSNIANTIRLAASNYFRSVGATIISLLTVQRTQKTMDA